MPTETERKFLVTGTQYRDSATRAYTIKQGYLGRRPTVRVRVRDDEGFITVKGPKSLSGMSCYEWEKAIPRDEAEELLQLSVGIVIDKTRYLVPFGGHTFEVDEFHGAHEGLVIAEIELSDEAESFGRPSWLGEEVTGDPRYYNSYLAR